MAAPAPAPDPAPAPAPAPAPDIIPRTLYYTMVVTHLSRTFNPTLRRNGEYFLWLLSNLTLPELGPILVGSEGSNATETLETEFPVPEGPCGRIVIRFFFQRRGEIDSMHTPSWFDSFVSEHFQAANNFDPPVTTRVCPHPL